MKGCFSIVSKLFIGILLILFFFAFLAGLATDPLAAIFWAAVAALGYYLYRKWKKNAEEKARKEAERIAEERRVRAIAVARSRPDLFSFDAAVSSGDIRNVEGRFQDLKPWAASIQRRYDAAKAALDDAEMVVNDDIEKLALYRQNLQETVVQKYEVAIRPFKRDLSLASNSIPVPSALRADSNFTYPSSLYPDAIQREVASISTDAGNAIGRYISTRGVSNIKKGDVVAMAIGLAISAILSANAMSRQRKELEQLQAEVDKYGVQIAGAVRTYGAASIEINLLREQHEKAVDFVMKYYDSALSIARSGKSISDLQNSERATIEAFYMGGRQLKQKIQIDIMNSGNQPKQKAVQNVF